MEKAQLGNSDLQFTKVGLGAWAIGGAWQYGWGYQDDDDSLAAMHEAIEAGINWFDTAPIYGCGHSEEVIGRFLKESRHRPYIATKCSLLWNEKREKINCLKAKSVIAECEASLRRLGIETIDLYQMHWPQPLEDLQEGYEAMAKCVKAGKVRYLGVSNFDVEQMQMVMPIHPLVSLQPYYNMFKRGIEKEILPFCKKNNIGTIVYSPMQKGLLTGKFTAEKIAALPADDVRRLDNDFKGEQFEKNLEVIEKLRAIAKRLGITVSQLAIAWVLRRPEVTAAIVGARRSGQIRETAVAADIKLPADEIAEIERILTEAGK